MQKKAVFYSQSTQEKPRCPLKTHHIHQPRAVHRQTNVRNVTSNTRKTTPGRWEVAVYITWGVRSDFWKLTCSLARDAYLSYFCGIFYRVISCFHPTGAIDHRKEGLRCDGTSRDVLFFVPVFMKTHVAVFWRVGPHSRCIS